MPRDNFAYTPAEIEEYRPWIESYAGVSYPLDHKRWLATVDALVALLREARESGWGHDHAARIDAVLPPPAP